MQQVSQPSGGRASSADLMLGLAAEWSAAHADWKAVCPAAPAVCAGSPLELHLLHAEVMLS